MTLTELIDATLRPQTRVFERLRQGDDWQKLAAFVAAAFVAYGFVAGSFQGGWQLLVSASKAPLIVAGSLALCLPSLWVMAGLSGAEVDPSSLRAALAVFAAILSLVLLALAPIVWLFSVATESLAFVVWLHLLAWIVALALARRVLAEALTGPRIKPVLRVWLVLFLLVSLQFATYLRPVLFRADGEPWIEPGKKFFLQHYYDLETPRPSPPAAGAAPVR